MISIYMKNIDQITKLKVMKTPRSIDVEITSKCNLRCKYCYLYNSSGDTGIDLSTEEWLQFFDELGKCSLMNICIAGGEPFIRNDLKELINGIVKNKMRFSILSNGTLITDDIAYFLSKTGRCNFIQISIDGSNPSIHDACRGVGSFKKAIKGIQILLKHKIQVAVRVTIQRYNVHDLENIAYLLLVKLGLKSFSTNSAGYLGLCKVNSEFMLLSEKERSTAMKTLIKLSKEYHGRIRAQAGPLAEALQLIEIDKKIEKRQNLHKNRGYGYLTGCNNSNEAEIYIKKFINQLIEKDLASLSL